MDDMQLLRLYIEQGSQEAFNTLVNRHIHLVYTAACRQVHNSALAEDVTQAVFIILIRKAHTLREGTILPAWLLTTTYYAAKNAKQAQMRRRFHEMRAAVMYTRIQQTCENEGFNWEDLAPLIDQAISRLGTRDRDALVLRFWEGKSLRDIAQILGISQNAAGKRIAHALTKLRACLARRGVTPSLAGLATLLASHAVRATPPATVQAVLNLASGAGQSAQSLAIADGAIRLMAGTTRLATRCAIASVVTGVAILLAHQFATIDAKVPASPLAQFTTAPAIQPAWQTWQILPGQGLGPIRLGMTPDQVLAVAGKPDRTTGTAHEHLSRGFALAFRRGADSRLAAIMAGDLADRSPLIAAFTPRTAEGLGMGSTLQHIVGAYGDPDDVREDGHVPPDDPVIRVLIYRKRGIEFATRDNHVVWLCIRQYPNNQPTADLP